MKEFLLLAKERRSCREFTDEPLEFDVVMDCLRAASFAPSVGDLQPWRFIMVTDQDLISSTADACPGQEWIHGAPFLVVVVSQTRRIEEFHGEIGLRWASQSCAAAIENLLLCAEDYGLSGCWVSSFAENEINDLYGVPGTHRVEAIVALGHPAHHAQPKSVDALDQVVFWNEFGNILDDLNLFTRDWGQYLRNRARAHSWEMDRKKRKVKDGAKGMLDSAKSFFQRKKKE